MTTKIKLEGVLGEGGRGPGEGNGGQAKWKHSVYGNVIMKPVTCVINIGLEKESQVFIQNQTAADSWLTLPIRMLITNMAVAGERMGIEGCPELWSQTMGRTPTPRTFLQPPGPPLHSCAC